MLLKNKKFWEIGYPHGQSGKQAALASTIVYLPFVLIFFFFAIYFYRDFARNKYERSTKQIEELESIIVRLEQNDMTYCQNMTCNNLNTNKRKCSSHASAKQSFNKQQSSSKQDLESSLILKNLARYNGSNDHLFNESMRIQSVSVDEIDKNSFKNDCSKDELVRSQKCRNIDEDCVRFSLDNVNFKVLNSAYSYSSLENSILNNTGIDAFSISSPTNNNISPSNSLTYNNNISPNHASCSNSKSTDQLKDQICYFNKKQQQNFVKSKATKLTSSKSIKLEKGTPTINDQQSNDSNKMFKEEEESFNNLSATVI